MGDFIKNLAKRKIRYLVADYQVAKAYTSFIVRLSFVIGSFEVGKRQEIGGKRVGMEWVDYQEKGVRREGLGRGEVIFVLFAMKWKIR